MITPYKCVIVANGSFPQTELPLYLLHQASTIIACDGSIEALIREQITPNAIVGDLDSLPPSLHEQFADRIHHVKEQETNDLTKSVHFAYQSGHKEVLILGATGLREDHTLGNISLLMEYATLFDRIEILSDYGIFTPLLQTTTLQCQIGTQVSIFSLSESGTITTTGLRWPIQNRHLTAWWQGTLNEALEDHFTIELSQEAKILVYRTL